MSVKPVADCEKWYFRNYVLVIAFLCVGPFALPLVWFNPRFNLKTKSVITVLIAALTCLLLVWTYKTIRMICDYYGQIFSVLE